MYPQTLNLLEEISRNGSLSPAIRWANGDFGDTYIPRIRVGVNRGIDTGTVPEDIWQGGGLYTGQNLDYAASRIAISSTSPSDTFNGVGARTVVITGLNADLLLQREVLVLQGTSPVFSTNLYTRMDTATVITGGTDNGSVGTITLSQELYPLRIFGVITPGSNRTLNAVTTIPSDYRGFMLRLFSRMSKSTSGVYDREAELDVLLRPLGGVYLSSGTNTITTGYQVDNMFALPFPMEPGTDILVRCNQVSASSTSIVSGFELLMVKIK